jgi:serine/threonine-protein kinase
MSWADDSSRKPSRPTARPGAEPGAEEFSTLRPSSETSGADPGTNGSPAAPSRFEPARPYDPAGPTIDEDATRPMPPRPSTPAAPDLGGPGATPPGLSGPLKESWSWPTIDDQGNLRAGQKVFGRYIVRRELGAGGMGKVWLVLHEELDEERALKTIISRNAFDDRARERFRREARLMAKLRHPHAVNVHDAQISKDVAFIDMEFVRGRSLQKLLKDHQNQPMPLAWTARILVQLCDVLQAAHDRGIIHRDLKPSNLMLLDDETHEGRERPEGQEHLKLLDLGISYILCVEVN